MPSSLLQNVSERPYSFDYIRLFFFLASKEMPDEVINTHNYTFINQVAPLHMCDKLLIT